MQLNTLSLPAQRRLSRREFLARSALLALTTGVAGCQTSMAEANPEPIIDIHQHVGYSGRPNEALLMHQRTMGVTKTILLPAGRTVERASTHHGISNGLQAQCLGNDACYRFARAHRKEFYFGANEVPDQSLAAFRAGFEKLRGKLPAENAPRADLAIGFATSMEKVLPRHGALNAAITNRVAVSLARNEKESFQVLVLACEGTLKGVRARIADLRSETGAVFAATNIQAVPVGYVQTKAAPPYGSPHAGWWPDPIDHLRVERLAQRQFLVDSERLCETGTARSWHLQSAPCPCAGTRPKPPRRSLRLAPLHGPRQLRGARGLSASGPESHPLPGLRAGFCDGNPFSRC